MPVLPHQIERHVRDGDFLHLPADLRLGREAHPLLDLLKAGPALVVERDDLAVEDDLAGSQRPAHAVNLRVARGDVLATPAHEFDDAAFDICLRPDAVPFELEAPGIVRRGRLLDHLGEHRLDALPPRLPPRTRERQPSRAGNPNAGGVRGAPARRTEAPWSPCAGPWRLVRAFS